MLAIAAAPWCLCASGSITVAVRNYSGASQAEITSAMETARRAFHSAGIETRWVLCIPENCAPDRQIELLVMPRLRGPLSGLTIAHPAGFAMRDGFPRPRAYALYDAARSVADRTLHPIDVVLGCIFVHETAHLLGLHHHRSGIMRANLESVDMDDAIRGRAFSAEEQKRLREASNRLNALEGDYSLPGEGVDGSH
jgi:hypothetical protein